MITSGLELGSNMNALSSDFELWKLQVEAARTLQDFERCVELLEKGLQKWGSKPRCQQFVAEVYSAVGQFMESLQCYDAAALQEGAGGSQSGQDTDSSFDSHIESLLCSAVLLSELGYYEEADLRFQAVCELDTDGGQRYFGKALVSNGMSVSQLRQMSFELVEWARIAWHQGDSQNAIGAAEKALQIIDTAEARLWLATFLMNQGEPARALENLEWGRRIEPSKPEFQTLAARCFLMLGKQKQAKDAMLRSELLGDHTLAGKALRFESKSW